jgi:hypothetical protein
MRYFVSGEQQRKLLLNALVLMFLAYMFLQWISNGMMYFHRMDLTFDSVVTYYNGKEEQFIPAKSYDGMLETLHFHLFSMGMLAVTLTHLMLMTDFSVRLKIWLSSLTFFSAIAEELAGWLVRFVHPQFAYFKIGTFILLELSLFLLIVTVSLSLIKARMKINNSAN